MKLKFTFLLLSSLFCYSAVMAQAVGDYQSNVTTTGDWDVAANWQRYDGMAWTTATVAPSSTDGVITIQSGDSIRLTQATTIDQVQVAAGGILSIFNTITPTTFTLADGPEASDINVDGRLYVAVGATLTGTGSVTVNAGGLMVHRNEGVLDVNTTIASMGDMYVNREPTLSSTLTNNGTITLLETGDINFADGTLINNGLFTFMATANVFVRSVSGTNLIQNTSTGVFRKERATGFIAIAVAVQNQGIFEGLGEFSLNNIASNNGGFSPGGGQIGILEVNEQSITGHTPTIFIQIADATPGVGHDQLQVNGTTSLSGVTLSVTAATYAPLGLYRVMTTTSGAFTGNFAAVNIPPNYTLVYTPGTNRVDVQKNFFILPLNWGSFSAVAKKNTVALNWSTLQETNTSVFLIEHSTNGRTFTQIGATNAAGNSNSITKYGASHSTPVLNGTNYYRIKQVDVDGKFTYSKTVTVQFKNASVTLVHALPNPVINNLILSVQGKGVAVVLTSANGSTVRSLNLAEGQHPISLSDLPSGVYHLSIYQNKKYVETKRIIKQ